MNTKSTSPWIFALIFSVAINGLLAGIVLSKKTAPIHSMDMTSAQMPAMRHGKKVFDNPRALIARLPEARREIVLKSAAKHLRATSGENPKKLFKTLHQSRKETRRLIRAETLDSDALTASLAKTRHIKDKLAARRNALVLEIFKQMTPQERQSVMQKKHKSKRKH